MLRRIALSGVGVRAKSCTSSPLHTGEALIGVGPLAREARAEEHVAISSLNARMC